VARFLTKEISENKERKRREKKLEKEISEAIILTKDNNTRHKKGNGYW
jgi:hypothetical protein